MVAINIKQKIKEIVRDTDSTAQIILYGSRATGKFREDSDWDLLILLQKAKVTTRDEQRFRHKIYELELQVGEPISTLVYSVSDWESRLSITPLYQNIKKEGVFL